MQQTTFILMDIGYAQVVDFVIKSWQSMDDLYDSDLSRAMVVNMRREIAEINGFVDSMYGWT